ncbi:CHAT domain-containing protein [Streptomyces edwardsiae]|uniref:CHAT domain-containing protein n=1 Tax=Streptomyces edwardsiae TaxID=3075527 RepID=A0ABU2QC85_9ACTN|nr:CHAT domain-containing protein [Streptomyces sp. DSM 41635]MDT0401626.1 CHAT domain-containing protein [Streptomyces sp. DSM 41635]
MGEAHEVELTLTNAGVEDLADGTELWTASVELSGGQGGVTGRGTGENLGALVAGFRNKVGDTEDLGWALRPLLLPEGVERAFQQAYIDALRDDVPLRMRIRCANLVFSALPWELARTTLALSASDPAGAGRDAHLVSDPDRLVVSRVLESAASPGLRTGLRSLVVTAADAVRPADRAAGGTPRSRIDWTAEAAGEAVRRLKEIGEAELLPAATREQLTERLRTTAHVVCVIAHGWTDRDDACGIVLHASEGTGPDWVPASELADLFQASGTQLVVLIACDTAGLNASRSGWGTAAHYIVARGVPAVVAMQAPVRQNLGQEFLIGLATGLAENGEIHAAMARGLAEVRTRTDIVGNLAVPALYTGSGDLRLREAPPEPVRGPAHAYPLVPRPTAGGTTTAWGTDGRRARLDVVWGLERAPFAGVLLDVPDHDLAQDLNHYEKAWTVLLRRNGLPARRWFATDVERPPEPQASWEQHATATQGEWHDFRQLFTRFDPGSPADVDRRADDGWVLRTELAAWSHDSWQERIGEWLQRLRDRDGRLGRPFVVVLRGPSALLEDKGPGVLAQVRDDLENRLGAPVTALSRHRPGKRYRDDGTARPDDDALPADANALSDLRRRDPGRYGRALERLAADERLPGHRASLSAAAEYDDDMRAWIGALGAGRPVPRPGGLPLDVDSERADTIALALLKQVAKLSAGDLVAWDDPLLSPPVRRLVRRFREGWAHARPDASALAAWLAVYPDSAPAAARAGLDVLAGKVLGLLPATTAPWPLLRAVGVDNETLGRLLLLPPLERHALGLNRTHPPPQGFDAALRTEAIRTAVGRAPATATRSSETDKARR